MNDVRQLRTQGAVAAALLLALTTTTAWVGEDSHHHRPKLSDLCRQSEYPKLDHTPADWQIMNLTDRTLRVRISPSPSDNRYEYLTVAPGSFAVAMGEYMTETFSWRGGQLTERAGQPCETVTVLIKSIR